MAKLPDLQNIKLATEIHSALVNDFMAPERLQQNVVGYGVGEKWRDGKPTNEAALIALVTHKVPNEALSEFDRVPEKVEGVVTDVIEVGYITAQRTRTRRDFPEAYTPVPTPPVSRDGFESMTEVRTYTPTAPEMTPQPLAPLAVPARRERPAYGGDSVGHYKITAGTIGTCVYDILPGGSVSPPVHGLGVPPKFYILSNNHVIANSNVAAIGDPILQPGPYDGGTLPDDRIATLSRFIPITFEPPIPRARHRNLVDAAVAEAAAFNVDREVHWVGVPSAWRRKVDIKVGLRVKKMGRTTGFTVGRVIAINATVDVGYGNGVARFVEQIITSNISAGGDSGSLVVTEDNVAVGLLFAGSSTVTILNYIENVRALLRVEVAERMG